MSAAAERPKAQPLEPGRTVSERYLVRRVLGQGGMGQVLEVEHVALGRAFALKVLRLERWNDELVRRFNREARALARVTTPRVAQVTDFGIDPNVGPFYVMELLEGETLEDRLEREGAVPPLDALVICAELCDALTEVHAAGIVHRDLKPSNVGLTRSGPVGVKLLDFGLAASMDDAFLSKITQSQQILGSLPYMAPEQFHAAEPTAAMDVYAVGIVLYEALTGRLPFMAPSTAALIHHILSTPFPPLPVEMVGRELLEPLLERLLGKEPHQRFASAAAAAQALREVSAVLGGPARRSGHPPTRAVSTDPLGSLPATAEAEAVEPIGFLPTIAMPESNVAHTPAWSGSAPENVVESGTRLTGGAPAPSTYPTPEISPHHGVPSLPASYAPPRASGRWPLRVVAVGVLGVMLAAIAGVGTVVGLSIALRNDARDDVPPPPLVVPVTSTPAPPVPAVAPAAAPTEASAPVEAPREVAPPAEVRPEDMEEPPPPEPEPEPRPAARRPRPAPTYEETYPPPPPPLRTPPPSPPPRNEPWRGGVADWND